LLSSRARERRSSRTALLTALAVASLILVVHSAQAARQPSVSQSIKQGQTLAGTVSWTAGVSGPKSSAASVTFSIDGVVRSTDTTNPFAFNGNGVLDTTSLGNGAHTFTVVATTQTGKATSTATATVQNSAPVFAVSQSVAGSQTLSGMVSWSAAPSGIASSDVARVEFLVDAKVVHTDSGAPYGDAPGHFDTKTVADGSHVFAVRATATDGRTADASATATVSNKPPTTTPQPAFPIYAAFYYPWYPETWTVNGAHVFYRPTLGYYSTTDATLQQAHIRALEYAGMEASISSWWGPGHYTDTRLKQLMQTTLSMGSSLKWAVYHELEGYGNPSADKLASELAYIRDNLATSPAYLKVNGRPVVFVYNADDSSCALNDRWKQANQLVGNAMYVDLKVYYGYRNCASQPDSWHQYGPNAPSDYQAGYSYAIAPGFWRSDEAAPRLARDPNRWQTNVNSMVASSAPWKLVTTFNEWTEGTAVESAAEWASPSVQGTYMDALHNAIVGTAASSATAAGTTTQTRSVVESAPGS
jgi:hypothetical protein